MMTKNKYVEALDIIKNAKVLIHMHNDIVNEINVFDEDDMNIELIQELADKEQTTCMGYKVEDLIIFANLLNFYQVDADTLHSSIESVKLGYKICQEDFKKSMQESIERVNKLYE